MGMAAEARQTPSRTRPWLNREENDGVCMAAEAMHNRIIHKYGFVPFFTE
jgi:hypothetical protein